ncbi:MAG: N-acetyltransferase [Syntrophales bacterium]|jgi:amino-acid N-acetyltransferase|nr:N-acetyltransferase [Syntrophales bacterium]MDY0044400.1 N-acetyltransferase [Syntrophales bacterium]
MLRKAKISDVKYIHRMINESSARGEMLPRSLMDLYGCLRDFFVVCLDDGKTVVGVCAMHIFWENLAEIRSLFVEKEYRRKGIATKLVEACISEAITLDLYRIFTLTNQVDFFRSLDFREVDKATLPEKVWSECLKCPKYPDYCDEVPMVIET